MPFTMALPSMEKARGVARRLSGLKQMKWTIVEIISEDGRMLERWRHRERTERGHRDDLQ